MFLVENTGPTPYLRGMLHRLKKVALAPVLFTLWCLAVVYVFVLSCIDWLISKPREAMSDAERREDDKARWRAGND